MNSFKIKDIFLILFICLSVFSCRERYKRSSIIFLLCNDSMKYWNAIEEFPITRGRQGLVFYCNGNYDRWWNNHDSIGRFKNNWHITHYQWKTFGDTLLWMGDKDNFLKDALYSFKNIHFYHIEYINDSVLILNNLGSKEISVYIKAKNQSGRLKSTPEGDSLSL